MLNDSYQLQLPASIMNGVTNLSLTSFSMIDGDEGQLELKSSCKQRLQACVFM